MKKYVSIIICVVITILLYPLCVGYGTQNYPNEYYNVYLDEKLLGTIISDKELLNYLSEINSTVYVYEEVIKNGSLGSLIVNYVYENQIKLNVKAYSLPNCYLEVGKRKELIKKYLPDLKSIIEKK